MATSFSVPYSTHRVPCVNRSIPYHGAIGGPVEAAKKHFACLVIHKVEAMPLPYFQEGVLRPALAMKHPHERCRAYRTLKQITVPQSKDDRTAKQKPTELQNKG